MFASIVTATVTVTVTMTVTVVVVIYCLLALFVSFSFRQTDDFTGIQDATCLNRKMQIRIYSVNQSNSRPCTTHELQRANILIPFFASHVLKKWAQLLNDLFVG